MELEDQFQFQVEFAAASTMFQFQVDFAAASTMFQFQVDFAVFVMMFGPFEAGARRPKLWGSIGPAGETGWSAPVPAGDRTGLRGGGGPLLGGVLGEHGLDGLDDGLHERFPFGTMFLGLQSWAFRAEPPFLRAQL